MFEERVAAVEDCLAEMTEEGRAGIKTLARRLQKSIKARGRGWMFGRKMALELIGQLAKYFASPRCCRCGAVLAKECNRLEGGYPICAECL